MGDTQEGEAVAETNVAQVVPAVTSEDVDEEPAPEVIRMLLYNCSSLSGLAHAMHVWCV